MFDWWQLGTNQGDTALVALPICHRVPQTPPVIGQTKNSAGSADFRDFDIFQVQRQPE